ncbi:MAG: beta-ketoacyl-ACP synthase II, partial [Dehalococcoidia bacterium]
MNQRRVFVTGMGVISPLGLDVQSTWQSLIKGQSGVDSISSFDAEGFETRIAAEVKGFDPLDYLERKEARRLDRFAQFACAVTLQAIHEAELQLDTLDRERVATLIGSGIGGIITLSQQFQALLEKGSRWVSPFLVPMMLSDMGSGQVSMMLGVKGPNFCTVSSCSSGADAMGEAWEMLRRGDVDVALAGGSEAPICPIAIAGFGSMRALSRRNEEPQKASRPFDAQRDGFVMGEGAAVLVLESEESVVRRGARPLVELVGYGASSDAHHVTEPAPGGEGSARAMKLALRKAGLEPRDIDYVNAHGTSTVYNDKFETMAIKTALGEEAHRIPVSSTKSMHGHLLGAGGALEAA